jgi:hypothetical protein
MKATSLQLPLRPRRQASQLPQEIWKGTLTSWPGCSDVTASPTSTTSPTHSWPRGKGGGKGEAPPMMIASRSHVATAVGRTSAAPSEVSRGSGASRHSRAFAPV